MKPLLIAAGIAFLITAGCSSQRVLDSKQSIEILKEDPDKAYAKPVLYFCPMDVSAVPYLMGRLSDPNPNIRRNAIHLLGKWLITPEAIEPLKRLYFKEPNLLVRKSILDASEILMASPDQAKEFIQKVVRVEKDPNLKNYASGMLEGFDQKRARTILTSPTAKPDAEKFKKMYAGIYQSAGKEGDLDQLLDLSSADDENALKALRIKILKGHNDQALFDYQKINSTILRHRYTAAAEKNMVLCPS